jgi:hypothetical protein
MFILYVKRAAKHSKVIVPTISIVHYLNNDKIILSNWNQLIVLNYELAED